MREFLATSSLQLEQYTTSSLSELRLPKQKNKKNKKNERRGGKGIVVGIGHSGYFPGAESEQEKTITKKIEKMSEDEAKGLRSELGTLIVFLARILSKKKQSPKKQYRKSGYILHMTYTLAQSSPLSPINHTADASLGINI